MARSLEKLKNEWKRTFINDELVKDGNYENVYVPKNKVKRDELRKEYIETLSYDKRLAIYLHDKLCRRYSHTDECSFYYEVDGLEDNWNGSVHKKYLDRSRELLKVLGDSNIDTIKKVIDIISRI